jgi:hypothetical protein
MDLNEDEITSFVDKMKDVVFESRKEDGEMVEGEVREEIFNLITGGLENETTMTNVEFQTLLAETIEKLSKHLLERIDELPQKLAIRFSFDVVSQILIASADPADLKSADEFDPMFG